ncbi:MAG: 3-deoxy-D-manno-octulosonic acid transferase [Dysgonamonadaceae bacterium]|nr:3-deoxy-D-manno-octulosonic acid transferase [Dysgonamonadaceae bacterium]
MYTFGIALYAFIVRLIAPFHKKAGRMVKGQRKTFNILHSQRIPGAEYIWFHASSLGEFEQGRPLIEEIKSRYPQYKILLTFFSPSGYEVRKNYEGADIVCYLPFDLPRNVERFLNLVQPRMIFFIKYEFWMNYLCSSKKRNIPTYIISAVFRPDQFFFRWYGKYYRRILYTYEWLFVQAQSSLDLLKKYNINNASISGDTRFDRVHNIYEQCKSLPIVEKFVENSTFTLVAGSSWPKDEDIFIAYFNSHPEMKLIIAPHEIHEDHLQSILSKLQRPVIKYSEATEKNVSDNACLIIDCFGLLSSIYRYGNMAYIGGGFGNGIHNILEAAVYGIPVIFGPNHRKFREAQELIDCEGGFSIEDETAFNAIADKLTTDKNALEKVSQSAKRYVISNLGATQIIMDKIGLESSLRSE